MNFTAPLHLGVREGVLEESLSSIPSDLLFSALCSVYRMLYGRQELEEFLNKQAQQAVLRCSSAFPWQGESYYLPRPRNLDLTKYEFTPKEAKRVRYMEAALVLRALSGQLCTDDLKACGREARQGILSGTCETDGSGEHWMFEYDVPRVSLDAITSASNIYYFSQISLASNAGLYCLVECPDDFWKRIQACFRLLAEEGIGGDRSCGKGAFRVEFAGEMEIPQLTQPTSWMLLSLYYPTRDEAAELDAEYGLLSRSGYMFSPEESGIRRKSLTMLTEGSVVYAAQCPQGLLADITPPGFTAHRVWRSGQAMFLPSNLGKGGVAV